MPRSDYMKSEFGFDNSQFLSFLEERGFQVEGQSRPNYVFTALSLSSSLNMEFVQNLGLPLVGGSYPSLFVEPIRHSRVRQALESIGYKTVVLSSGWTPTEIIDADTYLAVDSIDVEAQAGPAPTVITPFESQFLFTTPLGVVIPRVSRSLDNWVQPRSMVYPADELRKIILAEFENLGRAASLPGPKFVFAHIVAPHAPYLFTADGEPVSSAGPFTLVEPGATGPGLTNAALYRDQAMYVTQRIEGSIEAILRNSSSQPIIILQADHGSGAGTEWQGLSAPGLRQRTAILNAYLVPSSCQDSLYPTITPVNSFRVVLDCAFGASLPLLPDLTYYSPNPLQNDYKFSPVEGPPALP